MLLQVLSDVPFVLDDAELAKRAHVQGDDRALFSDLVQRARTLGKPKILYREAPVTALGEDTVAIADRTFTSRVLRRHLRDVDRVFVFVITCGMELEDAAPPADDFLADFWWEQIKAAVLGCAIHHFCQRLESHHQITRSAMMNPGAGAAHVWPIQDQKPLFDLLDGVSSHIGVKLTDEFLMRPGKTLSGIRFPTKRDLHTCQVCPRDPCPSRTAAFDEKFWDAPQHG